jgi:2-oxoglutarate/2-oxoacid ferredoxin oxidoreductase subunit beta
MMTATVTKPENTNAIGLTKNDYKGLPSTLCPGCGHDSISSRIIDAAFQIGLKPHEVIKLSGIGCSSKSPAYFLNGAHGINTVHGRMPSVTTGAMLAQRHQTAIGVSGDGDTGSIGLGQFKHIVRRNVPMVYIIENNGVYGLTKGQFSATADEGQTLKYAGTNEMPPLDLCAEAIIAGAGFVARSFAGDAKQVTELLKAAMSYNGIAVLDIVSPCVTFNNADDSTKSYSYGKEHEVPIHDITFVPEFNEIAVDYEAGEVLSVKLHDGPTIQLKKLSKDHNPTDKMSALKLLEDARRSGELVTGLVYLNESRKTIMDTEHVHDTPLALLPENLTRPSRESLAQVMASYM